MITLPRLTTALVLCALTAAPVAATDWTVDPDNSTLAFEYLYDGETKDGKFETWDADITFDPDNLDAASASVTVDVTSIDTGRRGWDRRVKRSKWFDTGDHPSATFTTTAFRATGETTYEADGTLTIRGNEQPITLPFTLTFEGDNVVMTGEVALDRKTFAVGEDSDDVGSDVKVIVNLQASKAE